MEKFEADCLEEVYELAAKKFDCSITDLKIEVIQAPSKGFLGFGRKNAIIQACFKDSCTTFVGKTRKKAYRNKEVKIEEVSSKIESATKVKPKQKQRNRKTVKTKTLRDVPKVDTKDQIFDNFYNEDKSQAQVSKIVIKRDKVEILDEVRASLDSMFTDSCYAIDEIKVEFYDDETLYIEFTGEDSALLIGKEGYRYKALSYILFNWINEKYGLMLRLEVAQFLQNQEEAIHSYIDSIIDVIKEKGSFKTKPLDGILVHIALKKLREEFPNKYVAVKTNIKGDKYVLVNEYRQRD